MATSVGDVNSTKYNQLSERFAQLDCEQDRQCLHALLDELNALDLKSSAVVQPEKAVVIIKKCCSLIPPSDTFLVAKGCQLITSLNDKQQIPLDTAQFDSLVTWCLSALKQCPVVASLDILSAVRAILRGNLEIVQQKDIPAVLEPFLEISESHDTSQSLASPWDLRLQAMNCLESLVTISLPLKTAPEPTILEITNASLKIFLTQLSQDKHPQQDEINFCEVLISAVRGIENIVQVLRSIVLGEALGVVKAFMLYGLPGHSGLKPQKVPCAPVTHSDLSSKLSQVSKSTKVGGHSRSNRKRQKKRDSLHADDNLPASEPVNVFAVSSFRNPSNPNFGLPMESWPRTSDSEYSDTESGQNTKIRKMQSRVRHTALALMLTVTKIIEKKELFGYWSSLLPDGPGAPHTRTLITCLLRDPSPRSRLGVLAILWTMLNSSRLYLLQAEHGDGNIGAFTPFSVSLGNMLHELHRSLCLALAAENSVLVLTQLLRVISIMVQNTPYHRLRVGLLSKVILSIRGFVRHTDINVQVAALTAFGSVVSVQPSVPELSDFVVKTTHFSGFKSVKESVEGAEELNAENLSSPADGEENVEYEEDAEEVPNNLTSGSHPPWILEICLGSVLQSSSANKCAPAPAPAPVRVERLQVISSLASHHFATVIAPNFSKVQQLLLLALDDSEETVRLHATKTMETVGVALQNTSSGVPSTQVLALWQELLNGPLVRLLSSDHPNLRSSACDCLASIGEHVFDQLPESRKIMCFTLLFGLASDEESLVRASAARALGIFVLFGALRKDLHFLVDCTEAILRTAKDVSLGVKLKASWSLGNLSDALVLNRSNGLEELPLPLTLDLLQTSCNASLDNEKIRSNGVRALGNLLRLIKKDDLCVIDIKESVKNGLKVLVQTTSSGSNMKVRWNACYAIGNVLKNSALYDGSIQCQTTVFPVLCNLVENFRNFKVRINAALALAIPESRALYGIHFLSAWTALLRGIDNSDYMADFNEYKHRDGLLDQICRSLCHLVSLTTPEDLLPLQDILSFHAVSMKQLLQRIVDSVVPEHAGVYISAASHTTKLISTPGLSPSQLSAATLLQSIFTTCDLE